MESNVKEVIYETVTVTKLVHGGQGLAELSDGRKVFVWNALPGETVRARIIKEKSSYAEAIAEEIIKSSAEREVPRDENYLSTSPWQMMSSLAENKYKSEIVAELFNHEKVALPVVDLITHDERDWHYRNKMEYSFWGDDDGLYLALHQRGTHGKQIVIGSSLAMPEIDQAADAIASQLSELATRAGDLKTIIVRANANGDVVAALYTKLHKFTKLKLPAGVKGLKVYHSNPRSPASVPTELLYELGNCLLTDDLLGKKFHYNVDAFFQVNVPVFEMALESIKSHVTADAIVDMYAGAGSIGLSVARTSVDLIELDPASVEMINVNADGSGLAVDVYEAPSENALDYIVATKPVIFDPPRAGLHKKVVERVLAVLPPQVVYLSCNPATQARDLALLQTSYTVEAFETYNFFPKTPHIETLAILRLITA
jgi:23S rRNA (uracil1939-C5)-methyltransferase